MPHRDLNPEEAKKLLDGPEGWIYLDVRTEEEFRTGHAAGARNLPIFVRNASGRMAPNPDFAAQAKRLFPKESRLVVGCASGVRSLRACDALATEGYTNLANLSSGFMGRQNPETGRLELGWRACGLPCE